jgi:inorganic pyrophosphatase
MRIDAIPIGRDPPHDVNVIVEVPLGGQPIMSSTKRPGRS